MSKNAVINALKKNKSFLVVTHVNPDGDALGCQLALGKILKRLKKTVYLYAQSTPPSVYNFLPDINRIKVVTSKTKIEFDAVLIIDCPTLDRVGAPSRLITNQLKIYIDHHPGPKHAGSVNLKDCKAASCAEIIYDLCLKMNQKIDKALAKLLYVGVATDTGFFRHPNTNSKSLLVASKLLQAGANAHDISKKINQNSSLNRLQLLGLALKNLRLYHDGKIGVMQISLNMFKQTKTLPEDTEEFVNFPKSIKSVKVAVLIREIGKGKVKISLRSDKVVDVNAIAAVFGGGGHKQASGCVIKGSLKQAEKQIVSKIKAGLKK